MLVLSRQKDQTIMIGDLIQITIVDIRGDKVRLGITAPLAIPVHRKEVYEAIQSENRAASGVRLDDVSMLERLIQRSPEVAETAPAAPAPQPKAGPAPRARRPEASTSAPNQ
jgi:carbon storage regulator